MPLVDDAVFLGFLRGHEEVAFDVILDLGEWLTGKAGEHLVEPLAELNNLLGGNLNVGGLTLGTARGLVNHNLGIREREALALLASGKEDSATRGRHAHTHGGDRWLDVVHGVYHRKGCRNRA